MGRYITVNDLIAYLSPNNALGTAQDSLLSSCIDRAESAIDDYTRRNFAGTAGTALYNRFYQERVIDNAFYLDRDLYSLSSLTTGNSQVVPVGSTWLEPQMAPPPYRIIRLHSSYTYSWNTDQNMQIVGTWGYSTVPPDAVVQATIRYAAQLFRGKDVGPGDVAGYVDAGEQTYPKGMPDDVRWLLSPYRSRTGGIV